MSKADNDVTLGEDESAFREAVASVYGGDNVEAVVSVEDDIAIRIVADNDDTFTIIIEVDGVEEYADTDGERPSVAKRAFPRLVGDVHASLRSMFQIPIADEFDFRDVQEGDERDEGETVEYSRRMTTEGEQPEILLRG